MNSLSCEDLQAQSSMSTIDIITSYGYPCEVHECTTDDGYILTMHRIPYGLNNRTTDKRPVVFLQHGLLDSSFTWVANPPSQSLAYILADQGFDVWLGNVRGNKYSRSHTTRSTSSREFWDFSWDEMVQYDLPKMIDYALGVAKADKLSYIGHSQGGGTGLALFSANGPSNAKVSSFAALAPAAYLGHIRTPLAPLLELTLLVNIGSQLLTSGEFLPSNVIMNQLASQFCDSSIVVLVCQNLMFLLAGYNTENMNQTRIPVYVGHVPAGTSSKNMNKYGQSYKADKFQKYDYGYMGNLAKYGTGPVPLIELNSHGVPVGVFYGGNDLLTTPIDVNHTILDLGTSVTYTKFMPKYTHLDFVWGVNAASEVYGDVLTFIRRYI